MKSAAAAGCMRSSRPKPGRREAARVGRGEKKRPMAKSAPARAVMALRAVGNDAGVGSVRRADLAAREVAMTASEKAAVGRKRTAEKPIQMSMAAERISNQGRFGRAVRARKMVMMMMVMKHRTSIVLR